MNMEFAGDYVLAVTVRQNSESYMVFPARLGITFDEDGNIRQGASLEFDEGWGRFDINGHIVWTSGEQGSITAGVVKFIGTAFVGDAKLEDGNLLFVEQEFGWSVAGGLNYTNSFALGAYFFCGGLKGN